MPQKPCHHPVLGGYVLRIAGQVQDPAGVLFAPALDLAGLRLVAGWEEYEGEADGHDDDGGEVQQHEDDQPEEHASFSLRPSFERET